jgi:hypothetical protein
MKSFNEFVSIKESAFTDAQATASKSIILKMIQKINGILNSMQGTHREAMAIKRESGKLEFAIMSMAKGADFDSVKKEYGDPLMLIQRINKVLQETPATDKEIMPIRQLAGEVELKIHALPDYSKYRSDMQDKIKRMPPAPPAPPNYSWKNS